MRAVLDSLAQILLSLGNIVKAIQIRQSRRPLMPTLPSNRPRMSIYDDLAANGEMSIRKIVRLGRHRGLGPLASARRG
jgi:hypothetical protein